MMNLLVATLLMVAYLAFVLVRFGVPRSLSDTYYLLDGMGWLFQVVLAVFTFLVIPVWVGCSSAYTECLAFLSCSGLGFVAAAACFKVDLTGMVHYVSAVLCCACAVLWQVLETSWLIPCVGLGLACLGGVLTKGKWFWWIEMGVLGSALVSIWWKV